MPTKIVRKHSRRSSKAKVNRRSKVSSKKTSKKLSGGAKRRSRKGSKKSTRKSSKKVNKRKQKGGQKTPAEIAAAAQKELYDVNKALNTINSKEKGGPAPNVPLSNTKPASL